MSGKKENGTKLPAIMDTKHSHQIYNERVFRLVEIIPDKMIDLMAFHESSRIEMNFSLLKIKVNIIGLLPHYTNTKVCMNQETCRKLWFSAPAQSTSALALVIPSTDLKDAQLPHSLCQKIQLSPHKYQNPPRSDGTCR